MPQCLQLLVFALVVVVNKVESADGNDGLLIVRMAVGLLMELDLFRVLVEEGVAGNGSDVVGVVGPLFDVVTAARPLHILLHLHRADVGWFSLESALKGR